MPWPWSGPVVAPMVVSASLIAAGSVLLGREAADRPVALRPGHWSLIVAGGMVVIDSFCHDARSVAGGAMPGPYPWGVFLLGEGVGLAAFGHACLMPPRRTA